MDDKKTLKILTQSKNKQKSDINTQMQGQGQRRKTTKCIKIN